MKDHIKFETIAVVLATAGAFVLVEGLMPVINPGFLEVNLKGNYSPRLIFLTGTLFSLPLLVLSWHFNQKAQTIRKQFQKTVQPPETGWEKRLKWALFGFVVLLVLYAFFF